LQRFDNLRTLERAVHTQVQGEGSSEGEEDGPAEKVRGLEGAVRGLEEKVRADGGRMERRMAEMLKRMEMLEEALRSEQETSLKALEAILAE
jgi:hypothetical protein